jgi:hypothetical protein
VLKIESILQQMRCRVVDIRNALAALAAHSTAGEAQSVRTAAARLQEAVTSAEADGKRVQRLLCHLRATAMPDAATKLCAGGRLEASRSMMDLYAMTCAMATVQAGLGAFLDDCMNSLEITRVGTSRQRQGGRLLGSA